MKPSAVNFANTPAAPAPRPRAQTHFGLLSLFLGLAVVIVGVSYVTATSGSLKTITNQSLFTSLKRLVTNRDVPIKGEADDRVNVLLLGIGGDGHDGAYLTDTIIVASIKPSTKQIALLSIPRDLAVTIPSHGIRKINAANAIGRDAAYPGGGEALTAKIVADVIGQPIQYFARVDFAGFTKLIDDVGGVAVTVDAAFTDREYPTLNYGYQTIAFPAGPQRMNGATALKFVRSRHGNNGEGSDFARASRQQKVLSALKEKLFSLSLLTSPQRLALVLQTFGHHTKTNLELWEMFRVASLMRGATPPSSHVLDTTPAGLLANETGIDGAYLLVPRAGDFSEIRRLARNLFSLDAIARERPRIAVNYAPKDRAAAKRLEDGLAVYQATVTPIAAAPTGALARSIVYDLTNGQKPLTRDALAQAYELQPAVSLGDLTGAPTTLPAAVTSVLEKESIDFLIILGQTQTAVSPAALSNSPRSS